MSDIGTTLTERGNRYGDFRMNAETTQQLKRVMAEGTNWLIMPDDMREALDMIQHKIGRILNGDPFYKDSWRDLAGYSTLIANTLKDET